MKIIRAVELVKIRGFDFLIYIFIVTVKAKLSSITFFYQNENVLQTKASKFRLINFLL